MELPRAQLKLAALSLGLTAALLVLGSFALALASGWLPSPEHLPLWLAGVFGWKMVIWAALLGVIAIWRPGLRLSIAAAAIAATIEIVITFGGAISSSGSPLFLPIWAVNIASFTVVAAIGCLLARATSTGSVKLMPILAAAALVVGGALLLSLPYQWFSAYFHIWGPAPVVTDEQGTRYLLTFLTAFAVLAAAVVLAAVQRHRALTIIAVVLLALSLILGFVFQVPQGRWVPEPTPVQPYNDDYVPCFGEGDPNCIGG